MILMPCFVFFVFIFCNRLLTQASHTVIIKHTQAPKTQFDASATAEPCKILPDHSATTEMANQNPPDVSLIFSNHFYSQSVLQPTTKCCWVARKGNY